MAADACAAARPLRRRRWLAAAAAGLVAPGLAMLAGPRPALAATPSPSELAPWLPDAGLLGQATMRFFGLRIYDLQLWGPAGFVAADYPSQRFGLALRYARSLAGADIARRSLEEMQRGAPIDPAQAERWLEAMATAFPDVRDGDRLTGLNLPGGPTRFFHNGRPTAAVAGSDFARRFFGIWLAPGTSEPGLRQQLLAGSR